MRSRFRKGELVAMVLASFDENGRVVTAEAARSVLENVDRAYLSRLGMEKLEYDRCCKGIGGTAEPICDPTWRGAMILAARPLHNQKYRDNPKWRNIGPGRYELTEHGKREREKL